MFTPDLSQLAQHALDLLRPELLVLSGTAAEGLASESGKQLLTWLRDRFKKPVAEAALADAAAHPDNDRRWQALQTQLEILLEEDESCRRELTALLANHPRENTAQQTMETHGNANKSAQVAGQQNRVRIS